MWLHRTPTKGLGAVQGPGHGGGPAALLPPSVWGAQPGDCRAPAKAVAAAAGKGLGRGKHQSGPAGAQQSICAWGGSQWCPTKIRAVDGQGVAGCPVLALPPGKVWVEAEVPGFCLPHAPGCHRLRSWGCSGGRARGWLGCSGFTWWLCPKESLWPRSRCRPSLWCFSITAHLRGSLTSVSAFPCPHHTWSGPG